MRPAEPGRRALLQAGRTLLATEELNRLSVNAITAEAKMAKGSFYQHWSSRRDYIIALHQAFHDELFSIVARATESMKPGAGRLHVAIDSYLDGCLAEHATKALLVQARTDSGLETEVARRNEESTRVILPDLIAIGWNNPKPVATLIVAAVAEVALAELTAGRQRKDLRTALRQLTIADKRDRP